MTITISQSDIQIAYFVSPTIHESKLRNFLLCYRVQLANIAYKNASNLFKMITLSK